LVTDQELDTKAIILESALGLFADHGFDGVSIRDIAQYAKVNVAAINYHFQNKANLYFEVVNRSHEYLEEEISKLEKDGDDLYALVLDMYALFLREEKRIQNIFKILISSQGEVLRKLCNARDHVGPPGSTILFKALKKQTEHNSKITDEDLYWAVELIFDQVIFKALMNCAYKQITETNTPFALDQESTRKGLLRFCRMIIKELRQ
jgi:hypothetical protein